MTDFTWLSSTEQRYADALGCLPPVAWEGERFLLGEPIDHAGRNGAARYRVHARGPDRRYWAGSRPVTTREFRAELPPYPTGSVPPCT